MKIFVLLLSMTALAVQAQITKKACFLGNSYTYFNNMPGLVDSLANHDGNDLIKDQNTPGGYQLNQHATNALSLSKIAADSWDFVILQEQSQMPSFPTTQVQTDVYPYAEILVDSIRSANACAVPLFFGTWGRRDGDPQWDSINTFEKMNNRLYLAYEHMSDVNSGMLSPVGIGFRHVHDDVNSPINFVDLYTADGSHPSMEGSYLAGCIFYNIMFETSPVGNTFVPAGLTALEATYLQGVAHHVVNDVDSVNLDFTQPVANFSVGTISGGTVTFSNLSQHGLTYIWDFGDNTTSTVENPTHTYSQNDTYTVTLTVFNCGKQDQVSMDVIIENLSVEAEMINQLSVYPNPAEGQVNIFPGNASEQISIYTVSGQLVRVLDDHTDQYSITLTPGIYLVESEGVIKKLVVK